MKLSTLVTGFAFTFTGVICQLTAPMQNYNVSSPVPNGPYVVGQVIPCTIELFENVMTGKKKKKKKR
jgi:hypothetical protein